MKKNLAFQLFKEAGLAFIKEARSGKYHSEAVDEAAENGIEASLVMHAASVTRSIESIEGIKIKNPNEVMRAIMAASEITYEIGLREQINIEP